MSDKLNMGEPVALTAETDASKVPHAPSPANSAEPPIYKSQLDRIIEASRQIIDNAESIAAMGDARSSDQTTVAPANNPIDVFISAFSKAVDSKYGDVSNTIPHCGRDAVQEPELTGAVTGRGDLDGLNEQARKNCPWKCTSGAAKCLCAKASVMLDNESAIRTLITDTLATALYEQGYGVTVDLLYTALKPHLRTTEPVSVSLNECISEFENGVGTRDCMKKLLEALGIKYVD